MEEPGDEDLYRIGTVASLTGVAVERLRAWERRYGLAPEVRAGKTRFYSERQLKQLKHIKCLIDAGTPISVLVDMSVEELEHRIAELPTRELSDGSIPANRISQERVFISYSHGDRNYLKRLLIHLKPLEKAGIIDAWADTRLRGGDHWRSEIERELLNARVAILLVSADFLASDFIVENELPPLLRRAEEIGTKIIPIVLKPCRFLRDSTINCYQSVNDPREPLVHMAEGDQEQIYDQVSELVEILFSSNDADP